MGVFALFKTIITSELSSIIGWSVTGTRAGEECEDFVLASTVFCGSEDHTPECDEYSEKVAQAADRYAEAAGYVWQPSGPSSQAD